MIVGDKITKKTLHQHYFCYANFIFRIFCKKQTMKSFSKCHITMILLSQGLCMFLCTL